MEVIQIGSFAILLKWLLLGLAILLGLILIKFWLQRSENMELHKKVLDLLSNSVFIGFFIWKGSLMLLEPSLVLKSPFSLLYFTGGSKGLIIAAICSISYFILKARKSNIHNSLIFQTVFIFCLAVWSMFHLLMFFFIEDQVVYHVLLGFLAFILLILSLIKKNLLLQKSMVSNVILLSFLNLIVSILFDETANRFFIFSIEQWFFIGLILLSLFLEEKKM